VEHLEDILDLHHQEEEVGAENTKGEAEIQEADQEVMEEGLTADKGTIKEKEVVEIHLKIAIKNLKAQGLLNDD
jgi:hypothetical protein